MSISNSVRTGPLLPDKSVAIISGALGDIGQAIAMDLARHGADIALGDVRDDSDAKAVVAEIETLGRRARYDRVDVTDAGAVRQWVVNAERTLGPVNLIIPNAATATLADFRTVSPEQWSRELRVNLDGAFHLAQAATLRLIQQNLPGRVVFIGSWAAHAPHVHIPAYCVAKAGLRMLCQCMALDLARTGILVNEVAPGYVDAGMSKRVMDLKPGSREAARKQVPVGELMTAQDVAIQVRHLCDAENRHMTGSVLLMDGGLSLKRLP